jgi:hypothetical protein
MAERGGQPGNKNATKGKRWQEAIERALERRTGSRIDQLHEIDACADALIDAVLDKDMTAIKEFGDRIDGKVMQNIEAKVQATIETITRKIVDPRDKS